MSECRLCNNDGGLLIWSGEDCRIVQIDDPDLPGFYRVIWHQHVTEMSSLTEEQRQLFMRVVFGLEGIVTRVLEPAKINLASLGNQVPHLHWHVIPRFRDDAFFPDSIWSERRRDTYEDVLEQRKARAESLPRLILGELDNWLVSSG